MRKIQISLFVVLAMAVLMFVLTGCGRKGLININGDKIAKDEFYQRLERVPVQTMKGGKVVTVPAGQYVIEQIISEKLVQQLAKKENVAPTDDQIDKKYRYLVKSSQGGFKQQLAASGMSEEDWKHQMQTQQSMLNIVAKGINVSDTEVKGFYDEQVNKNPSPFKRPAQVKISAILCQDKAKADKAYKLLTGGQDFGTIAMQLSDDPNTRQQQGQVGFVSMDMDKVPMAIRTTAFSLAVGKFSKPFFVPDSNKPKESAWVILKSEQKRPAHVDNYNDVKDMIKEQIAAQKGSKQNDFGKQMRDFIQSSKIVVNAERYKKIPDNMKKDASTAGNLQTGKIPGATDAPANPGK